MNELLVLLGFAFRIVTACFYVLGILAFWKYLKSK